MKCPKCGIELVQKFYKGTIETDACPQCRGFWLDLNELDKLEDLAFDEDARKGSLVHYLKQTDFPCPHCAQPMKEFQYRLYDLHLDYCAENAHGFWLDGGEDERVMALMRKRAGEIERQENAEAEWRRILKNMRSVMKKRG